MEKLDELKNLLVCTGRQGKLVKKIVIRCVIELLATVKTCQRKLVHSSTTANKTCQSKTCQRLVARKHKQMKIVNDTCQGNLARV